MEEKDEEKFFPREELSLLKEEFRIFEDDMKKKMTYLDHEIRSSKEELRSHRETIEIKKIHVFQLGLVSAVYNAFIGIIFGILMLPLIGLLSAIPGVPPELSNILGGGILIVILLITILFFILGFISGIIEAIIYNLIVSMTGGIKYDA